MREALWTRVDGDPSLCSLVPCDLASDLALSEQHLIIYKKGPNSNNYPVRLRTGSKEATLINFYIC